MIRYLFPFLMFFTSVASAQDYMLVIKVSQDKVTHNGKTVRPHDTIFLIKNNPLPTRPTNDFFNKNHIVIASGGVLKVKYKNRLRVLDFNAYRGLGAKKMPMRNANCLSRDGIEYHTCDNDLSDEKFFHRSLTDGVIRITSDTCLSYYFNAPTYWQYGTDTLQLMSDETSAIGQLIFEVEKKCIRVKRNASNHFIIPWDKLPQEGVMRIYRNKRSDENLVGNPYFLNLKRFFAEAKKSGLNSEECLIVMRSDYVDLGRDPDSKYLVDRLKELIEKDYHSDDED